MGCHAIGHNADEVIAIIKSLDFDSVILASDKQCKKRQRLFLANTCNFLAQPIRIPRCRFLGRRDVRRTIICRAQQLIEFFFLLDALRADFIPRCLRKAQSKRFTRRCVPRANAKYASIPIIELQADFHSVAVKQEVELKV